MLLFTQWMTQWVSPGSHARQQPQLSQDLQRLSPPLRAPCSWQPQSILPALTLKRAVPNHGLPEPPSGSCAAAPLSKPLRQSLLKRSKQSQPGTSSSWHPCCPSTTFWKADPLSPTWLPRVGNRCTGVPLHPGPAGLPGILAHFYTWIYQWCPQRGVTAWKCSGLGIRSTQIGVLTGPLTGWIFLGSELPFSQLWSRDCGINLTGHL